VNIFLYLNNNNFNFIKYYYLNIIFFSLYMSVVQTPEFVSNNINYGIYSATQESCSVVDANANENIYTSLINASTSQFYGSIQKTTSSGTTTNFLQLNSGNTPGGNENTVQYPRGMCFDSSRSTLYYVVYNNPNIFKITNFTTPNPSQVNTISQSASFNRYFRIIIDNQYSNIFYMSTTSSLNGVYSIFTYTISPAGFSTVFNLSSPNNYGASYGIAQDFTGQYLYIGLGNGGIIKGELSSGTLTPLLTLPQSAPVVGLIFNTKYTLIANTSNGFGYKITIDPSTGTGTYQLYYDTAGIIGGLGLTVDSTLLYGISENQLFKVKGDQYNLTGYNFLNNTVSKDFADIFKITYPNPGITTGYKSAAYGNLDLGQIFAPGNSGISTNYFNTSTQDLGSLFQQIQLQGWFALGSGVSNNTNNRFVSDIKYYNEFTVYVCGYFTDAGGESALSTAIWNPSTSLWSSFGDTSGDPTWQVYTIAIDSIGNVYVGGYFQSFENLTAANGIVMWTKSSNQWSTLGTGVTELQAGGPSSIPSVYDIKIDSSGNVYVGGSFKYAGGLLANCVAKWTPGTGTWSTLTGGLNGYTFNSCSTLAIDSSNNVYVGGTFVTVGQGSNFLTANSIAKWTVSTGLWSIIGAGTGPFGGGTIYGVSKITINPYDTNIIYIGGFFTSMNDIPANNIATYTITSGTTDALGSGVTGAPVNYQPSAGSIEIDSSGNVYVGGLFNTAGGNYANCIAIWTPGSPGSWSNFGNLAGTSLTSGNVHLDPNGNLYVGGSFSTAGDISASCIALYKP
jgi:hypothetical protein